MWTSLGWVLTTDMFDANAARTRSFLSWQSGIKFGKMYSGKMLASERGTAVTARVQSIRQQRAAMRTEGNLSDSWVIWNKFYQTIKCYPVVIALWVAWRLATREVPGSNSGKGDNYLLWIKMNNWFKFELWHGIFNPCTVPRAGLGHAPKIALALQGYNHNLWV